MKQQLEKYLRNAGHEQLLDMQARTIESVETNNNTVLYSGTGTGKTIAFLLSFLNSVDLTKEGISGLILAPSRELCLQIESVFRSFKSEQKILTCYGGHSIKTEENSLKDWPKLLIGTPGRIADHIDRGNLDALANTQMLIIDEYDKCLEFGFEEEMKFIIQELSSVTKRILASATELEIIPSYAIQGKYDTIKNLSTSSESSLKKVKVSYSEDIVDTLFNLLCSFGDEKSIVFCNYREVTDDLSEKLDDRGLRPVSYHGGLDQDERERALLKYRNGSSDILICTDLGARGLDIPDVKHVIHYQYPGSEDAYIHREGRTARMDADGTSYLFEGDETQFPEYITPPTKTYSLKPINSIPKPKWSTIYFSGGKKDKINKIDLVGFLCKKGGLNKDDIGLIHVRDYSSFVAINTKLAKETTRKIRNEKIKGKRLKIAIAY